MVEMNKYLLFLVVVLYFPGLEFKCSGNDHVCGGNSKTHCIPNSWVCDYFQDCDDNSDEINCPPSKCEDNQFKCHHSSHCISISQVCDGKRDCLENDDERDCNKYKCDQKTQYNCNNLTQLECIPLAEVCKTKVNCTTQKDLTENCNSDMCIKFKNPCSHNCINRFSSYVCDCPPDMELADDKKTCKQVNKCLKTPSVCHQSCKRNGSDYKCFCYNGYVKHEKYCKPQSSEDVLYLLFSSHKVIYSMPLFDIERNQSDSNYVYNSSYNILSFDATFNGNDMVLYSTVVEGVNILEISHIHQWPLYNTKSQKYKIDKKNVQNFENFTLLRTALDPARNLLFFTDYDSHSISVMNLTNLDKVRIIEDCYFPHHIVIDPVLGRIFWIDLGNRENDARIIMANMDGSNKTILQKGLKKPTSLALDIDEQRLYWIDHSPSRIKYIDLNTISNSIIETSLVLDIEYFQPFSLFVFENRIYWSDWQDNVIYSAHKDNGNDVQVLTKSNKPVNLQIISIGNNRQLIKNINEQKIAKYCSGLVNICPSSCLPNYNMPETPKCFGFSSKVKSNNNSLWLILIPVFVLGCLFTVLFKYRFTRTRIVRQPESGNVYIYDNVKFYEDQNSICHENIDSSDAAPIISNVE